MFARQLGLYWLALDPNDLGYTKHARYDGYWESWITSWVINTVPHGSRCIDIGANMGYYTFLLNKMFCTVDAFEPQPDLADLLELSKVANQADGVTIHRKAVADKMGEVEFYVPEGHGMNASYAYPAKGKLRTYSVPTISLDEFGKSAPVYDFVKVDAEGAEYDIWSGMQQFWARSPECLILMEWRWDRFTQPEEFANQIFDVAKVAHVGYDGLEHSFQRPNQLGLRKDEDWMLVLRRK